MRNNSTERGIRSAAAKLSSERDNIAQNLYCR